MQTSIFAEFVEKYFQLIVGRITETFNEKKQEQQLMHKSMLTEDYSPDMHWDSTNINRSMVAADVVSLGSPLPLKKRDRISRAGGRLPKVGILFHKDEQDISDINVMIARGARESSVAAKIMDDVKKAIRGVDLRNEILFLEGLSTGMCLVDSETNDGTGIRADFGYKKENTMHAITAPWTSASATPVDDINQIFEKAVEDSVTIEHAYISEKAFKRLRNSEQGKALAARYMNVVFTATTQLTVPKTETMLEALKDEFGATFHIVKSSIRIENPDGSFTNVKPFAEDNVVFTPTDNIGRLVYGTLAEETNPVNGVDYEKSGSYVLVSKFSENNPLMEYTSAQAICLPVIDEADSIYLLHTDATSEGLSLSESTLTYTNDGGKQTVDIHYDGDLSNLTITSSETFVTVKRTKDKLAVTAAANSSTARTATVTVSDGTLTATVSVSQAAGN